METLQAHLMSGSQFWVVLVALAAGLVYAAWFKSERGALLFAWLMWFVFGLGMQDALGLTHDLTRVVYSWTPWNFLVLALIPAVHLRSAAALALLGLLALQLVVPIAVAPEAWNAVPDVNEALFGWITATLGVPSPLPLLMLIVALAFFIRWKLSDQAEELAGVLVVTLLMIALMRTQYLTVAVLASGGISLAAVLYSSHRMAFVDALTGVRNRRSLESTLRSPGRRYAIAMLDIDHFKRINDRFGHDFGDQVLRSVATRLKNMRGFTLYRYGGEEFCLLFRGGHVEEAEALCESARAAIGERPVAMRGPRRPAHKPMDKKKYQEKVPGVKVTVSIGLARPSDKAPDPLAVREAADKALYRSKKGGRNKVSVAR